MELIWKKKLKKKVKKFIKIKKNVILASFLIKPNQTGIGRKWEKVFIAGRKGEKIFIDPSAISFNIGWSFPEKIQEYKKRHSYVISCTKLEQAKKKKNYFSFPVQFPPTLVRASPKNLNKMGEKFKNKYKKRHSSFIYSKTGLELAKKKKTIILRSRYNFPHPWLERSRKSPKK